MDGTDGDDTFLLDWTNFDQLTILSPISDSFFLHDVIQFGEGIVAGNLQYLQVGADLEISSGEPFFKGIAGQPTPEPAVMTIHDFFLTTSMVDTITFADGTVLSGADLWQQVMPNATVSTRVPISDGGHVDMQFDGGNSQPWTSTVTQFGPAGDAELQIRNFDDGSVSEAALGTAGLLLKGGHGADTLAGGGGDDLVDAGAGNDAILGGNGNDTLLGGDDVDTVQGGDGNDLIDGGAGPDSMAGGTGNDTYAVDNIGDTIVERPGEGTDAALVAVSGFVLPDNVENGSISVTSGLTLSGNELANTLQGNIGNDTLIGGDGNDTVDGGAGADSMAGGTGNDTYAVDNLGDTIAERPGEGTDAALVSVSGFVLPDNVENGFVAVTSGLTLSGNADPNTVQGNVGNDTLIGGGGDDTLLGGAGVDTLQGGAGNDTVDGGAGADSMAGGTGNDAYAVDSLGDTIVERPGEGTDAALVSVTGFILPDNVENGTVSVTTGATLSGNAGPNTLQGDVGNDTLIGGGGDDTLHASDGQDVLQGGDGDDLMDGGTGIDTLIGGAGDDIYLIDNAHDVVVEAANGGSDSAFVSATSYVLADNVENGLVESVLGATLTGNALDNSLEGNVGTDVLTGGAGNDNFVFRATYGHDTITDFHGGTGVSDIIGLTDFASVTNFDAVLSHATQQGADTLLDFGNGDQLLLRNVVKANLAADDFHFG